MFCVCVLSTNKKKLYVSKYGAAVTAAAYTIHILRHIYIYSIPMLYCIYSTFYTLRMFCPWFIFALFSRPIFIMPTFVFDYIHFGHTHSHCCCFPSSALKCMCVCARSRSRSLAQSEERTRISQQQQRQQQQQQKERTL